MKIEQIEQILALRSQNHTHHQIASQLGFCTRTVLRVLHKYGHELAVRNLSILEATFQKSGVGFQDQAFFQAALLRRLEDDLTHRPLKDLPLDRLSKLVITVRKSCNDLHDRACRQLDKSLEYSEHAIDLDADEPGSNPEPAAPMPITPSSPGDTDPKNEVNNHP